MDMDMYNNGSRGKLGREHHDYFADVKWLLLLLLNKPVIDRNLAARAPGW